jgi:hypothetical protein
MKEFKNALKLGTILFTGFNLMFMNVAAIIYFERELHFDWIAISILMLLFGISNYTIGEMLWSSNYRKNLSKKSDLKDNSN